MSVNKTYKEKYMEEKAKMAAMDKATKKGYIFDYYLKPALAITAVVLIVGYFFYNMFFGAKEIVFEGAGVNVLISESGKENLTIGFRDFLGEEDKEVDFESDMNITFELEDTDQYAYANRMKLMAMVSAGEVDYFIMSREVYENLNKDDLFLNLDSYQCSFDIENGNAIVLTDTAVAQKLGIDSKDGIYLAFLSSGKKQDTIQAYIDFMYMQ